MIEKDLLGNPVTDIERETYALYQGLRELAARPEAPPSVARNAAKAASCLWQSVNDLALHHEHV